MEKENCRIIFMGTPAFAVESLRLLIKNKYNVVGVVTMPDKPAGRGYKMQESEIKKYALSLNIPVLQPVNLKDSEFIKELKALSPDLNIVVAFRMLPEVVWDMPKYGTYNLHASLLPQYRGAAPINWAIINGETTTGVTTFKLVHEIDSGDIAFQEEVEITKTENAGLLHDKLMQVGARLVVKTVDAIIDRTIVLYPQTPNLDLKLAPKIFRDTCRINWASQSDKIYNLIRGLSPYPTAFTVLKRDEDNITIKIFDAIPIKENHSLKVGTILIDPPSQLKVAVQDGFIQILELQIQGRRRMKTKDLLNGFTFQKGDIFI